MDELLIKYLSRECSPAERKEVEDWVEASQENRHYFADLQLIWEQSGELVGDFDADDDAAWHRFQQRVSAQPAMDIRDGQGGTRGFSWKIAAGVIALVGVALYFLLNQASPSRYVDFASNMQVLADTLPDGTVATLNKRSVIHYPSKFTGNTRAVKLEGEAFFSVTPDKKKPFVISVNDVEIKVVGTSFNVRSGNGVTEVIVETGVVQVMRDGKLVELHPGERISIGNITDSAATKQESGDKLYNYYVSKTFICDNTPLWKLVDKLNEAYDAHIVIARPELRKVPLNVTFNEESLDRILDVIRQTLLVQITTDGDKTVIR